MTPITLDRLKERGFYLPHPFINIWRIGTRFRGFEIHPQYCKGDVQDESSTWDFDAMFTSYSNWSNESFGKMYIRLKSMEDIENLIKLFKIETK
jgi:hypothetical protein